ncbi:3-oxoacyl-ACP synthase III family protein [Marinomonas transparens]|uniref:Ketoacyl-ACP synthase III n=1 Tax=Marinomonas transparens TaxID=2795388 RepID=A0A934JTC6_9GAMM|nr:ketoacyl-ACP synthase III [Marinomonas transparens]MBJ7537962.1 ketoacyl-ACP synthase III [Marinomonas transparens]
MLMKGNCQIAALGTYFPKQVVTSRELMREIKSELHYGISEHWLSEVCGIDERRVASAEELPSVLAIKAAEQALSESGINARDIDAVIFCGISREWLEPSIAHKVQHELGCTNAISFDVSNACHGFMNGIIIADSLIQCSDATHVLVVTGEASSDITNYYVDKLRNNSASLQKELGALTLGDAGAAMVLTPKIDGRGFQYFNFYTNAKYTDLCKISLDKKGRYEGQMVMGKISSVGIRLHSALIEQTYLALQWQPMDIAHFICHQTGRKPHQRMSEVAKVSPQIMPVSYKHYGNITTATIPVNLYNVQATPNQRVLIAGAGSGISISQSGFIA